MSQAGKGGESMRGRLRNLVKLPFRTRPAVGTTPADVVHEENKWRLLRYRARPEGVAHRTPVLLVPSLINRHYVLDLMPGKSFAEYMVGRGHDVFMFRTFWIRDSMHLNTVGLGNPTKRTCSTCHGMHMTGMDTVNGWMDIGTTNLPWASEVPLNPWNQAKPQLPLFKITCKPEVSPHPFLGRVIYTQDPGRALITGLCNDVGTIVMQQFRGLSARAPYFSNGSAQSIRELIDFYDRRYDIQFSEQEKTDLGNFLAAL